MTWFAPLAAGGTLTVGPAGSGAQFTEIQAAVDAALADDVILVRPGTYARIVVDKPLRILGDGTGLVRISGIDFCAIVTGIGAGEELVLSGMEVVENPAGSSSPQTILLRDCPGTVILQDLVLPQAFLVGVQIENCGRVLVLDSRIHAGAPPRGAVLAQSSELWIANSDITGVSFGGGTFSGVAHGVELVDARLHLWRSRIQGGGPGSALKGGSPGGAGIRATRSSVDLFGGPGTTVAGGPGGLAIIGGIPGAAGGPGLDLLERSRARIQDDANVQGGLDGDGLVRAPAVRVDGTSSFALDPKVFPTLVSSAQQVQVGSTFGLTLTGNAGGYQVLFLSVRTGPTSVQRGIDGFGILDRANLVQLQTEVLPASGSHTTTFRVPNRTSLIGTTLFLQAAERFPNTRPPTGFAIGNPVLVTITG